MSNYIRSRTCCVVSALLLTGTLALAQATTAASTDKKDTAPAATAREASSGMATGKRQDQFPKVSGAVAVAPPSGDTAEAKKHVANIKWQDRQASSQQTLDGASKDAAKSPVSTLDATSKDAAKSKTAPTTAQDSKHVNKIESLTVKQ